MKKIFAIIVATVLILSMVACGGATEQPTSTPESTPAEESAAETTSTESEAPAAETATEKLKVVYIANASGLGDRSFNDSAWAGIQKAEQELGIEASVIEPAAIADFGSSIVAAADSGANVIIGFGGIWGDVFEEYCIKYPDISFFGLNATTEADNLSVALTSDHEGSFLAGALAAMKSQTGTIGAIGGQDSDNINRFLVGYEEGAKYVNPEIKVLTSYVGSFSDPAKGKEFSLQLINEGADVIYHVAAASGEGLFEVVKENEAVYAIGVDSDQDYIAEGKVLTSMMKNCDVIAYDMVKSVVDGKFEAGSKVYSLENDGVGLSPMTYTKDIVGEEALAQLEEIKGKIISGEIVVTDLFNK